MPLHLVTTDRPIRPLPAGCDQQQRYDTRTHRVVHWPDSETGSPDTLGDDQAEQYCSWAPVVSVLMLSAGYLRDEHGRLLLAMAAVAAAASLVIFWPLG